MVLCFPTAFSTSTTLGLFRLEVGKRPFFGKGQTWSVLTPAPLNVRTPTERTYKGLQRWLYLGFMHQIGGWVPAPNPAKKINCILGHPSALGRRFRVRMNGDPCGSQIPNPDARLPGASRVSNISKKTDRSYK